MKPRTATSHKAKRPLAAKLQRNAPPACPAHVAPEPVGGPTLQPALPSRPAAAAKKKKRGRLEDNIEFKDIEPYLHLPQVEAADKLGFW